MLFENYLWIIFLQYLQMITGQFSFTLHLNFRQVIRIDAILTSGDFLFSIFLVIYRAEFN